MKHFITLKNIQIVDSVFQIKYFICNRELKWKDRYPFDTGNFSSYQEFF